MHRRPFLWRGAPFSSEHPVDLTLGELKAGDWIIGHDYEALRVASTALRRERGRVHAAVPDLGASQALGHDRETPAAAMVPTVPPAHGVLQFVHR